MNPRPENVLTVVQAAAADVLGVDAATVTPNARFAEDLAADSLNLTELAIQLEQRLDLVVPDEALESVVTVADAVGLVRTRIDAGPTRPPARGAAFFDLDKTLIPGSSLFLFARGLHRRGLMRTRDIAGFGWAQLLFRAGGTERAGGMKTAREGALAFVRGRSWAEIADLAEEVTTTRILPNVYPEMADLIKHHRSYGRQTVLVTASPIELATLVAEGLGMSGALGTLAEVDEDGYYTGELSGPVLHGAQKALAVTSFAQSRGIDLASSFVYSDSINDLPLLERVGYPHAVNPDRKLRDVAGRDGWPVRDLRRRRRRAVLATLAPVAGGLTTAGGTLAINKLRSMARERAAA